MLRWGILATLIWSLHRGRFAGGFTADALQQFVLQGFGEQWVAAARSRLWRLLYFVTDSRADSKRTKTCSIAPRLRQKSDFTAEPAAATEETKSIRYDALAPRDDCVPGRLRGGWRRVGMAAGATGDWRLFETLRECAFGSGARGRGPAATHLDPSSYIHATVSRKSPIRLLNGCTCASASAIPGVNANYTRIRVPAGALARALFSR